MNALDILKYGNRTVLTTLDDLPQETWETPGVCGYWSVKDIIAHLASYEQALTEVLSGFNGGGPTPTLEKMGSMGPKFNDYEVNLRQDKTTQEVLDEYLQRVEQNRKLAQQIPGENFIKVGALPWYGEEYALDDYLVYQFYGHKREHSAQIAVYKDQFKSS